MPRCIMEYIYFNKGRLRDTREKAAHLENSLGVYLTDTSINTEASRLKLVIVFIICSLEGIIYNPLSGNTSVTLNTLKVIQC